MKAVKKINRHTGSTPHPHDPTPHINTQGLFNAPAATPELHWMRERLGPEIMLALFVAMLGTVAVMMVVVMVVRGVGVVLVGHPFAGSFRHESSACLLEAVHHGLQPQSCEVESTCKSLRS